MNRRCTSRAVIAFASLTLCWCGIGFAQPAPQPWWIGATLGYGFANNSVSGLHCLNGCPEYNGGIGGGVMLGASVDWYAAPRYGLSLRLRYVFTAVTMQATSSNATVKDTAGNEVPFIRNYSLTTNVPEVLADMSGWYRFGRATVSAGLSSGILLNPTWQSSVQIISPANVYYRNGRTDTVFFPTTSLDGAKKNQFHVSVGAGYDVPLSHAMFLTPELTVYIPLTSISTTTPWYETILAFGLTVKYAIGGGDARNDMPPLRPAPKD